jgi:hypothetical protein
MLLASKASHGFACRGGDQRHDAEQEHRSGGCHAAYSIVKTKKSATESLACNAGVPRARCGASGAQWVLVRLPHAAHPCVSCKDLFRKTPLHVPDMSAHIRQGLSNMFDTPTIPEGVACSSLSPITCLAHGPPHGDSWATSRPCSAGQCLHTGLLHRLVRCYT